MEKFANINLENNATESKGKLKKEKKLKKKLVTWLQQNDHLYPIISVHPHTRYTES